MCSTSPVGPSFGTTYWLDKGHRFGGIPRAFVRFISLFSYQKHRSLSSFYLSTLANTNTTTPLFDLAPIVGPLIQSIRLHAMLDTEYRCPFLMSFSSDLSTPFVQLREIAPHVALASAPEAASFVTLFLSSGNVQAASLFTPVCALCSFSDCGRVDVHCIRIPSGLLSHWSSKRFASLILACAEEVTPSRAQACNDYLASFYFATCSCLPIIEHLRNQIPLENRVVDSLTESLLEHFQGSFRGAFPSGSDDQVSQGGDVLVYIVAFHFGLHELCVFNGGGVHEHLLEVGHKIVP